MSVITKTDSLILSHEQHDAIAKIKEWFDSPTSPKRFAMGGLAGTGKTTIIRKLPDALKLTGAEVAYCAYTGKAADVLTKKLGTVGHATTIDKLLYTHRGTSLCASCPLKQGEKFCLPGCREHKHHKDLECDANGLRLIVVDEASMVDDEYYGDLMMQPCKILFVGDHGQLPPMRGKLRVIEHPDIRLETIVRQQAGDPILDMAHAARAHGTIPIGQYGPQAIKRKKGDGKGLSPIYEATEWSKDYLALCYTNRERVSTNKAFRRRLGMKGDSAPQVGDRLVCLRNAPWRGVVNGSMGFITQVDEDTFGDWEVYAMTVALDDGSEYKGRALRQQFNWTGGELNGKDPYKHIDRWDFGYCLTVHKAQGSEADHVIVSEGRRVPEHNRWLYTAVTRAKKSLEVIDTA